MSRPTIASLAADLAEEREARLRFVIDLVGDKGDNGKIGALRADVRRILGLAKWVVMTAVGSMAAAAIKLILVGRAYGELETQVEANRAEIVLIQNVLFLTGKTP